MSKSLKLIQFMDRLFFRVSQVTQERKDAIITETDSIEKAVKAWREQEAKNGQADEDPFTVIELCEGKRVLQGINTDLF